MSVTAVVAALLTAVAVHRYFCIDFGDGSACAQDDAEEAMFVWLVFWPGIVGSAVASVWLLRTLLLRRNARRG